MGKKVCVCASICECVFMCVCTVCILSSVVRKEKLPMTKESSEMAHWVAFGGRVSVLGRTAGHSRQTGRCLFSGEWVTVLGVVETVGVLTPRADRGTASQLSSIFTQQHETIAYTAVGTIGAIKAAEQWSLSSLLITGLSVEMCPVICSDDIVFKNMTLGILCRIILTLLANQLKDVIGDKGALGPVPASPEF